MSAIAMAGPFDLRFLTVSIALHAVVLLLAYISPGARVQNFAPIPVSILDTREKDLPLAEPKSQRNRTPNKPAIAGKKPAIPEEKSHSVKELKDRKELSPPPKPEPALEKSRSFLPATKETVPENSVIAERPLPALKDLLPPVYRTEGGSDRATMTLNTSDPLHVTYMDKVKQLIDQHAKYPAIAETYGLQGRTALAFTITASGQVEKLRLVRTSGYQLLDEIALEAVKKAAPFPPIPPWIKPPIPIDFGLEWIPPKNRE